MSKSRDAIKHLTAPKIIGEVLEPMVTQIEQTMDRATQLRAPDGTPVLGKVEAFSDLLGKSIKRVTEIMDLRPETSDPNFARITSTQQAIAASVFSTAARIDETQLRRQNADKIDEILRIVREEEDLLTGQKTIAASSRPIQ